jgi:hypothetical protein
VQASIENSVDNTDNYKAEWIRDGWIPLEEIIRNFDPAMPVSLSFAGASARFEPFVRYGTIPAGDNAGKPGILLSYMPTLAEVVAVFPTAPTFQVAVTLTQNGISTENPVIINIIYDALIS